MKKGVESLKLKAFTSPPISSSPPCGEGDKGGEVSKCQLFEVDPALFTEGDDN